MPASPQPANGSSALRARARLCAAAPQGRVRGRSLAGTAITFSDLCAPPAWVTASREEGLRLGALGALLTVAPDLRSCIDGAVLAPLADAFGDDVLEAALDAPNDISPSGLSADPDALRDAGADLFAAAREGDADAIRLMNMAADIAPACAPGSATDVEAAA